MSEVTSDEMLSVRRWECASGAHLCMKQDAGRRSGQNTKFLLRWAVPEADMIELVWVKIQEHNESIILRIHFIDVISYCDFCNRISNIHQQFKNLRVMIKCFFFYKIYEKRIITQLTCSPSSIYQWASYTKLMTRKEISHSPIGSKAADLPIFTTVIYKHSENWSYSHWIANQ